MGDLRDQIRHDENALQRVMEAVPGFREYREKEIRRSADRLLREHLVGLLDKVRIQLTAWQRDLADSRQLKLTADAGRLTRSLVRVTDLLEHATYGYAGFLAALKVHEAELDRLYDFDLALIEVIGTLGAAVESMRGAPPEDHPANIRQLSAQIEQLEQIVAGRSACAANLALP
jgi:hypothetical protein